MTAIDATAETPSPAAEAAARPRRSLLRIYRLESTYELLKLLRLPAFAVPTLAFPWLFYVLFGLAMGGSAGSLPFSSYLLATYGVFGVVGAALLGIGVGVAGERGQGWLLAKRATPMPFSAWLFAKIAAALVMALIVVMGLCALAAIFGGVRLPTAGWLQLTAVLVVGTLPFCAFGLALGYLCGPSAAPAVANLIHLPLAFVSGLWIPVDFLPPVVRGVARFVPQYYLGQLALGAVGGETRETTGRSLVALLVATAIALALAWFAYRRDEGKTYG